MEGGFEAAIADLANASIVTILECSRHPYSHYAGVEYECDSAVLGILHS